MFAFMTVALVLLASASFSSAADSCMKEGQTCSKTIFQRCCGELLCDLKTFGAGVCVKCLDEGRLCGKDSECCSGRCSWLKCTAKETTTTTAE
ncbi:hypothetical protein AAHC03_04419 [Spirometra sp. Aus1]